MARSPPRSEMVPSPFDGTPANAGAAARNTTARKRRRIQSSGKSAGEHDTGRIAGAKFPDRDRWSARALGRVVRQILELGGGAKRLQVLILARMSGQIAVELDGNPEVVQRLLAVTEAGQRAGVVVLRFRQIRRANDQLGERLGRIL